LDIQALYSNSNVSINSSGKSPGKPQADILLIESRWLATFAERKWARVLPASLADLIPKVSHWERVAKYGRRNWGIPLGTNFLVSIALADEPGQASLGYDYSAAGNDLGESISELDWIVDRFLLMAAAANPTPSDSSFLFKPTGAKSRLDEAWLAEVATAFSIQFSVQQPDTKSESESLFRLSRSAESAWDLVREVVFASGNGWPDITPSNTDTSPTGASKKEKQIDQKLLITAPKVWVDSGRTLIALIADTNRQSAASETFLRWLNDDTQRQWLSEITTRIKPLPENTKRVTDRPDRDTYDQLIASAVTDRYVAIELQFDGADTYRELLGKVLVKILRGESTAAEALQICHRDWESLTNTRGRERQQLLLYRALELAKWE